MSTRTPLHLFQAFGIELEYMIVDAETLDVRPIADELLAQVGGGYESEVELGDIAWSNELALHVIELKTNGPVASLSGVAGRFHENLRHVRELLGPMGARLLPTGMHPWMDPARDLRLWPHEFDVVYRTFDRIFSCKGHGWANLQSMHINLPFEGDDEFGRLHAAIRLVLPILPALAASTPLADGAPTGFLDTRLEHYRQNARAVPSVTGLVVPERAFSRAEYDGLLGRIYTDLEPHDPEQVLRHEWVNARGAIARFDRMAIEIRLIDLQECPRADLAIAAAVIAVVRALADERTVSTAEQRELGEDVLAPILVDAIRRGDEAVVDDARYLACLGHVGKRPVRMRDLWTHLVESTLAAEPGYDEWRRPLERIASEGPLARRILDAVGQSPDHERLLDVYRRLADCLDTNEAFTRG